MYRYDLHCHTKEVSPCGSVPAAKVVSEYRKAGYSGLVVTDHVYEGCRKHRLFHTQKDFVTFYMQGYHALCKAAGNDFTILLGMEIRFEENHNDYLVYGVTEAFLRRHNGLELCKLGITQFSRLARAEGLFLAQAHPFRKGLVQAPSKCLDGVEVNNGNPRHNSRNADALAWAAEAGLAKLSGSDYHELEDLARGGIETEEKITSSAQLIALLKSGNYRLIEAPAP